MAVVDIAEDWNGISIKNVFEYSRNDLKLFHKILIREIPNSSEVMQFGIGYEYNTTLISKSEKSVNANVTVR